MESACSEGIRRDRREVAICVKWDELLILFMFYAFKL